MSIPTTTSRTALVEYRRRRDSGELKTQVYSHMRMLQRRPTRVQAYSKHPKIRCADWPKDPYLFVGLIFKRGKIMKKIQVAMDKLAIGFSIICAVHCVLVPIAMVLLPALAATPLRDEAFHKLMLIAVLPASIIALAIGCRKHKNWRVGSAGVIGLAILIATAFLGHDLLGENGEKIATLIGATIISFGHIQNHRLCCKYNCHS